ncbi:MAG TPA: hypothetical protein VFH78_14430 [Candidatus Thermoplasmatota archaeon]|nr:hypothetical protein [Candidatus Thermoplasmatota archaeon]
MLFLAQVDHESPGLNPYSVGVSAVVAALAFVLAVLAWRAAVRRGNPALRIVAVAFGVFGLKNVFSAYNVLTHLVPHDAIELVLSLFDLVLLLLLFLPLVLRRRS